MRQSDLDAEFVTNLASVEAGAPSGPVRDEAGMTVTLLATPSVSLTKTIDQTTVPDLAAAGDLVTFSYLVTSTGNVTLRMSC